ncbi:hypothetical protein [Micromonospora sp. NPDC049204]|uniref:hypothetical protein n=1 Tax=Micromonospora sp. NPDC049204 TaxID=3154351 RepID=UPI00340635EC
MSRMQYRNIDFRPAMQAGWRSLWIDRDGNLKSDPIVGWLLQEFVECHDDGHVAPGAPPPGDRERRVVAAIHAEGFGSTVFDPDDEIPVWRVLGPDQENPSPGEIANEYERRKNLPK